MITGRKEGLPADTISSARSRMALVFVALIACLSLGLFRNYDRAKSQTQLPLIGTVIHLGEEEDH